MRAIFERRSIRDYQNRDVESEKIEQILRAGMAAPTSTNNQEWEFDVIKNKEIMYQIMEMYVYASALQTAPVCIAVCANKNRVSEPNELFWVQDLSAAAQNMLIAATALELGSLWLGLYSNQRNELKRLLHLPDYVDPLMLLVFGYAKVKKEPVERYLEERVHFDSYSSKTIFD